MKVEALYAPHWLWPEEENLPTRRSLLSRLRNEADDASWRIFFDTYWQLIYHVACKAGLSDADAQDVVQETVISVARRMPEFRYDPSKGSFKKWLLVITRRRIQDHFRRLYHSPVVAATRAEISAQVAGELIAPTLPADVAIDAAWELEWRQNLFQTALARVRQQANPKHYQAFDYCVLHNLPAPQVAAMLGMNAAQVYLAKHRISRALKRAAAALETELAHPKGY